MTRIYFFAFTLLVTTFLALQGCDDTRKARNYNKSEAKVDETGYSFLQNATADALMEIEASTVAKNTSKNVRIVKFADMMIDHHGDALEKLKKIQSDKMVTTADTMSLEQQKIILNISERTGAAFDSVYIDLMVKDHEKAIALYTSGTESNTKAVRKLAEKTLPAIKVHLDLAKAISATLK